LLLENVESLCEARGISIRKLEKQLLLGYATIGAGTFPSDAYDTV
jgi:hypothetical protein